MKIMAQTKMAALTICGILCVAATAAVAYTPENFNPATDQGQDFTKTSQFDTGVWTNVFGSAFWFSGAPDGLWMSSSQSTSPAWQQSGFMQISNNCASGFGYGTFHWRMRIPASGQAVQGPGVNLILWRADGKWIDASIPGVYTEMEAFESWDESGKSGTATMHYNSATAGQTPVNGQEFHAIQTDLTVFHDYDLVWEAGSVAEYVDGVQIFKDTNAMVPKDFAHGGCNETLGAQVMIQASENLPTVQMALANSWWRNPSSSTNPAPSPAPVPTPTPVPGPVAGDYTFVVQSSQFCLDVPGASTSFQMQLQQYQCNGTGVQKYTVSQNSDGTFTIVNDNSKLCPDVRNNVTANGNPIQQYACNQTSAQKFKLTAVNAGSEIYRIVTSGGSCFDVDGSSNHLQVYECLSGNANQTFQFRKN